MQANSKAFKPTIWSLFNETKQKVSNLDLFPLASFAMLSRRKLMKHSIFKQLAFGILIIFVSMAANVLLHELGHFAVADALGFNPALHIEAPISITGKHVATGAAYTTYSTIYPGVSFHDVLIAAAGPLINAALVLAAFAAYIFSPKRDLLRYGLLILMLVSVISLAVNIIPLGATDGRVILSYLVK